MNKGFNGRSLQPLQRVNFSEYGYKYTFYTATFEREHVQRLLHAFFVPLGHDTLEDVVDYSGTH